MSKPKWFQMLTDEDLNGYCQKHSCGFRKNIFRLDSCDVVCMEGLDPYHIQPHIQVFTLFDINGICLDQISHIFDCSQIQMIGEEWRKIIALRPWRDCVRSTQGCTKHVFGVDSKFCSFTCKVEHVLEQEGDLSSITKVWPKDDSREMSEHVGDLSVIHPCGDPAIIVPFKKRTRKRREFFGSDEDIYASY